jgi:hypothetical protein
LIKTEFEGINGNKIKTESYVDLFVQQYSSWFNAIQSDSDTYINGEDVLPSIKIISQCYKMKKQLSFQWVETWN